MGKTMRSSLRKPSFGRNEMTEKSWRDHPVVVAAIAAGAVVTLMGGVNFPLLTTHITRHLEDSRKESEIKKSEISELKITIVRLEKIIDDQKIGLKKVEDEKKKVAEQFRQYTIENPFLLPSAYPRGQEVARVGSAAKDVEAAFEGRKINKEKEDYWSVETEHPIFASVTYYFDSENGRVTHILFHTKFQGPVAGEDVLPLVERYFGKPMLEVGKNHLWRTRSSNGEYLTVEDGRLLLVYGKEIVPNWLAREFEKCNSKSRRSTNLPQICQRNEPPASAQRP